MFSDAKSHYYCIFMSLVTVFKYYQIRFDLIARIRFNFGSKG